jgi:predicted dehydrogenase
VSRLRVGVAGLGRGRKFAQIFAARGDCELVSVCDVSEKSLAAFDGPATVARHTDYQQFLAEGLDLVAVITPGPGHAVQSTAAMQSGAHVLCETPCVYSLEEAADVLRVAESTDRSFMLAEDYIWQGWARSIERLVRDGLLGEIVYAEGDYTHDCRDFMLADDNGYVPYCDREQHPGARKTWRATGLPPLVYCSHTLGPLLHIMEDRVQSAVGLGTGSRTAPELGAVDLEAALLKTSKGAVIRLTNGFSLAHPMGLFYSLCGTRGSVKLSRVDGRRFTWYSEFAEPAHDGWQPAPPEWMELEGGRDHLEVMIDDLVVALLRGEPPPIDAHRSMDFVLPGIIAHQSAESGGEKLEVPDLRKLNN